MVHDDWLSLFLWWILAIFCHFRRALLHFRHCVGPRTIHVIWRSATSIFHCAASISLYFGRSHLFPGLFGFQKQAFNCFLALIRRLPLVVEECLLCWFDWYFCLSLFLFLLSTTIEHVWFGGDGETFFIEIFGNFSKDWVPWLYCPDVLCLLPDAWYHWVCCFTKGMG